MAPGVFEALVEEHWPPVMNIYKVYLAEMERPRNTRGGSASLFDWFRISYKTTDNFCFYLQNRLIQTSQTGGQQYRDIPAEGISRHVYSGEVFLGENVRESDRLSTCLGHIGRRNRESIIPICGAYTNKRIDRLLIGFPTCLVLVEYSCHQP